MSRIAICIGVNNVQNFTPLKGASKGAVEFSKWATAQGYDIKLFTDENKNIVRVRDIYDCINQCLEEMKYNQIIVYFSGHGISRGPNQEFWFLSEGGNNGNEIVDLTRSADNAVRCPIPYVLFISDACRSLPTDEIHTTGGQTIFPNQKIDSGNTIDIFYATRPGAPAFEIAGDSLKEAHGIFTESLIAYLSGEFLETIVNNTIEDGAKIQRYLDKYYDVKQLTADFNYKSLLQQNQKWIISGPEVDIKLKEFVESRSFGITKGQSPEIRVNNHKQEHPLSIFTDEQGKNLILNRVKPPKPIIHPIDPLPYKINKMEQLREFSVSLWKERSDVDHIRNKVAHLAEEKIFASEQLFDDPIYNKYTGIEVIGEEIIDLITPYNSLNAPWKHRNKNSISFHPDDPYRPTSWSLLRLKGDRSVPIAIIEGFIAQLVFKDGYLFTVNYSPAKTNHYTYDDYQSKKDEVTKKRSLIAISANNGFNYKEAFQKVDFSNFYGSYNDAGSFLRMGKSLDPALGMYAAYAFRESGDFYKIRSVYKYMAMDNPYVPFDVAMLAGKLNADRPTAAFCPLMSIGWSYKHLYEDFINPKIIDATKYLEPGLWTTFTSKGTELLITEILNNQHI
ncbi:caspase family protein [Chryseobacterium salivictor]|uniref:Peptidase C14 caspase domain-containing protein n=1 Tax=Chryseobacterium salivictor TaxID=2547600 RepID=A0A4P6ZI67_9FLAO|nr:caspase family protein [Chryseobacterium salivictor]QBO59546.1 hypothetical protein NBC122_02745 [Chryseobacterium salivictor]